VAFQEFVVTMLDIWTVIFRFFDFTTLITSARVCSDWGYIARHEWNLRFQMLNCWVNEAHQERFWTTIYDTRAALTGAFVNRILYWSFSLARIAMLDIVVPLGKAEEILQVLRDAGYDKVGGARNGKVVRNGKVHSTRVLFNTTARSFRVLFFWIRIAHRPIFYSNVHTFR